MVTKPIKRGPALPSPEEDPTIDYPESDGQPLAESDYQLYPLIDFVRALGLYLADRPDVYVSGDMLIYYRMNDTTVRVAPDVFVVFGVADHWRRSYNVWREGKAPDFVLEIASEGNYRRDIIEKREIYARLGVPEYWRFNPTGRRFAPPLVGERLADSGHYEPLAVHEDNEGILRGYSPILGLDICVRDGELKLFDPISGAWLRNLPESEAALAESDAALADSEAALAESDAALAESEAARQESDAGRAVAETELQSAQERIRRLEEQLRQQGLSPNDSD